MICLEFVTLWQFHTSIYWVLIISPPLSSLIPQLSASLPLSLLLSGPHQFNKDFLHEHGMRITDCARTAYQGLCHSWKWYPFPSLLRFWPYAFNSKQTDQTETRTAPCGLFSDRVDCLQLDIWPWGTVASLLKFCAVVLTKSMHYWFSTFLML